MAVDYNENEHLNALLLVLEDHTSWFNAFTQLIFYPEDEHETAPMVKPTSFVQWLVQATNEDGMPPEIIEKLSALHSDLFRISDALVQISNETKKKPVKRDFKKLLAVYEEFFLYIRRVERDILLEGIGYDAFTGLRSRNLVYADISRELQRLDRQGKSFCVAMVKIDDFDLIKKNSQHKESDGYIKLVASLIKLSIRSFDDAYYMGGDEFILCLKQTEISGGISALERLRTELEKQDIKMAGDSKKLLSMSCCIAEPVIGDNAEELVENQRLHLERSQSEKTDTLLEYHELSPLQRYVQDGSG